MERDTGRPTEVRNLSSRRSRWSRRRVEVPTPGLPGRGQQVPNCALAHSQTACTGIRLPEEIITKPLQCIAESDAVIMDIHSH